MLSFLVEYALFVVGIIAFVVGASNHDFQCFAAGVGIIGLASVSIIIQYKFNRRN